SDAARGAARERPKAFRSEASSSLEGRVRSAMGSRPSMTVRPRPLGVLCRLLVVASLESGGAASAESVDQLTPVLATVVAVPAPVHQTDGLWKLPYEIELTNVTDVPMTIESVEVRAPERGDALIA